MTCFECGEPMKTSRENVKYDAVGLPGITLRQIEVRRCPACGETEYVIPHVDDLHRAIARAVVGKRAPLTGVEIRFLRKTLGWSGSDFAAYMGTTAETVSRWEHDKMPMNPQADRLLRALMIVGTPQPDYSLDLLKDITPKGATKPLRVGLRHRAGNWTADAAA